MIDRPSAEGSRRSRGRAALPRRRADAGMMEISWRAAVVLIAMTLSAFRPAAQERKPVPKDSVRVSVPGCTKGYVFTAGRRTVDEPGSFEIREGMHLRMNGAKSMMTEIKAHEGSMIEITGIMKKGQYNEGVKLGG